MVFVKTAGIIRWRVIVAPLISVAAALLAINLLLVGNSRGGILSSSQLNFHQLPGNRSSFSDATEPSQLLCGDPDAIPLLQDALDNSTTLLWANAVAALQPWDSGFTDADLAATAEYLQADGARADINMLMEA